MERKKFARKRKAKRLYLIPAAFAAVIAVLFLCGNNRRQIISVPYISQQGTYVTGCELVSTAMVLNYYRYDVSVKDVVTQTPCSELSETKDGLVGEHPSQSFIGNPTSESGFGCYAPVVVSVLNTFFRQDNRKKAVDLTGTELEDLIPYVDQGDPVIVWATINMHPSGRGDSWTLRDTGEEFTWPSGEHCLVLVGYDRNEYYFNDPYDSKGLVGYDRDVVRERYAELGKQAVAAVDF